MNNQVSKPFNIQSSRSIEAFNKQRQQDLHSRGIKFHETLSPVLTQDGKPVIGKDGKPLMRRTTVVDSISDREKEISKFYTSRPCWFNNCEELRKQYKEEREQLTSSSVDTKNGTICTQCGLGPLMRKYNKLVGQALDADPSREKPQL